MSPAEDRTEDEGNVKCSFECEASSTDWAVVEARITEELNDPYRLSLLLRAEGADVDASEMLAEPCTVTIARNDLETKYPGIVHWIEDVAESDSATTDVSIEVSAAFWMLSQTRKTRVFQNKTVPEILDEVLDAGLSPYDRKHDSDLQRSYPTCEYRVQYDESDFSFCERLMEEEGIAYRFDREGSAETMFLTDDPHASVDVESVDGKDVPFAGSRGLRESVDKFTRHLAMRPTKVSMRHFNWTLPSLPIEEEKEGSEDGPEPDGGAIGPEREIYCHDLAPPTLTDYTDNDGYQANDAADQCQIRRERSVRDRLAIHGSSTVIGFRAGGRFGLVGHALEGDYLLTKVTHTLGFGGSRTDYDNHFVCIPAETAYRPERRTPKPRVTGIETATVVGPSGQEIHTDKHGRIRVQFHWDREGQKDDHSSCFIRVVQPWAGAGWGFVFIPRIGMEVTVAFVQGDPDRPIVTGTVYNGENPTSYEMPSEMTKSTIRTNSSPGGGGYNELSFEDKAGEEEIFLQAQKNLREAIKNNHAKSVGADHSVSIGNDQTLTVSNNRTTEVGNDKAETVSNNKTTTVAANFDETIGGNTTQSVSGDKSASVGGSKKLNVTAKFDQIVGGMKAIKVGGLFSEQVGGSRSSTVVGAWSATAGLSAKLQSAKNVTVKAQDNVEVSADKNLTIKSAEDFVQSSEKKMSISAKEDFSLVGEKKAVIEITEELTIKVGSAQIDLKKNGDIVIKGAKISVKGSGDVVIKGSKVGIN